MKHSLKTGISFGLTSGIITTLGIIIGLHAGTHSRLAVIGGILTIAIADAFSDALGIHTSEEAEDKHSVREIWESTFSTFLSKFFFTLSFIIPILLFELFTAIIVSIIYGLFLLVGLCFYLASLQKVKAWKVIGEHVGIALAVVFLTHYFGELIALSFG
ncbi:MAG: hypothetical protein ACKD6N_04665 [Candidatus Bathyarchaeota archaeon]